MTRFKKLWGIYTFSLINTPTFLKSSHTTYLPAYEEGSVPKRRHIKFRRRGIIQKKKYRSFIILR